MAKPSWIRAVDGDWYRTCEVVAVKTLPHPEGGLMVSVETRRHDNVEVTGHLEEADAGRSRDDLVRRLSTLGESTWIWFNEGGFQSDTLE